MANVARLPRAAEVLRDQVRAMKPRTKTAEPHGDLDGFSVYRSLIFPKSNSTWLKEILDIIEDPRINESYVTDDGRLVVVFVASRFADITVPFPLEKVADVLGGQ